MSGFIHTLKLIPAFDLYCACRRATWLVWTILFCCFPQFGFGQEQFGFSPVNDESLDSTSIVQTDEEVSVPAPSEPNEVFATRSQVDEQSARIRQLEQQLYQLQTTTEKGLAEGRVRSTDVPRVEDLKKTPDFPKVRLTGFFQLDAGFFDQDAANRASYGDIEDVRGFRRARLAAVGDVSEYVSYMLEMDFATAGRPSFMDLWFDVHQVPVLGNVRVGQFRQPFGLDELTSVRELTFIERSFGFALAPFRQVGVGFHNNNESQRVTWSASAFGFPTDVWGDSFGDKGYGLAARITALPRYIDDSRLVHIGFDYALTRPSTDTLRYRSQPEFSGPLGGAAGNAATVPFFVDTNVMNASSSNLLNWELAAVWDSFYFQSEARLAIVDLTNGNTATFPTCYGQVAYALTGEKRIYNKVGGVVNGLKPLNSWGEPCGYGAVELAGRYSYMDLNSGGVNGGRINDLTAGINWYLNQYTKLQFNYIHSMPDQPAVGRSNADILAVRGQVGF